MVVELQRRADLLDAPVLQHDDAVGHRHRLDLVVRDVDRRRVQALVERLDLDAHLHPQLGVEVGQRLVEQEDLRVAHDRPAHRDALALAARELARIAVEVRGEVERFRSVLDLLRDRRLRLVAQLEAEGHVVAHRHVRIERVVLEHHRDVAILRRAGRSPRGRRSTISPPDTSSSPAIRRSSVDLPHPEGPTRTRNSPSATSRSTACSTCVVPNALSTARISIAAMGSGLGL